MQVVKQLAKKTPGVLYLYRSIRGLYTRKRLEEFFSDIYRGNRFLGEDSVSGPGSDLYQTRIITKQLPTLFRELSTSTMLDIPCGDFHWMNSVDLDSVDYIGADIVKEMVQNNREKYERANLHFQHLNLISGELPKVDLVFCRDCLVHFSFTDILLALRNIYTSGSKYLLTTTFPSRRNNHDIVTGSWRPLNLEIAPFNLPKPLKVINEGCTEGNGAYSDKSLGLWQIEEIRKTLSNTLPDRLFTAYLIARI